MGYWIGAAYGYYLHGSLTFYLIFVPDEVILILPIYNLYPSRLETDRDFAKRFGESFSGSHSEFKLTKHLMNI
ncbi:hypothetical protein DAMNIGENAA_13450 [Desulforhabdus amnigena]|jgi:hypothetical protein|uniref:Uncharacterized protein n=1 Tax=Desulforhabdus amnigena TaxID=40218 RepID=A0A9W6D4B1_9BACT|nr:hypothetical protein DAMNIGENAA_13450 [Desulforhabdus amnigena]